MKLNEVKPNKTRYTCTVLSLTWFSGLPSLPAYLLTTRPSCTPLLNQANCHILLKTIWLHCTCLSTLNSIVFKAFHNLVPTIFLGFLALLILSTNLDEYFFNIVTFSALVSSVPLFRMSFFHGVHPTLHSKSSYTCQCSQSLYIHNKPSQGLIGDFPLSPMPLNLLVKDLSIWSFC